MNLGSTCWGFRVLGFRISREERNILSRDHCDDIPFFPLTTSKSRDQGLGPMILNHHHGESVGKEIWA